MYSVLTPVRFTVVVLNTIVAKLDKRTLPFWSTIYKNKIKIPRND